MLRSPILFIIFNRIDTASQVFKAIRNARPQKLYIACDGPRPNKEGEDIACQQTRSLAQKVDWPCQVQTMFLEENLGPSLGPYSFIKWFFTYEEQGIILEHDCLPHPDFSPTVRNCLTNIEIIHGSEPFPALILSLIRIFPIPIPLRYTIIYGDGPHGAGRLTHIRSTYPIYQARN